VASPGSQVDPALVDELAEVGADAARDGTPLPEVLLILRISRDLVVQTAVEVAEERGRRWGLALSLVLTRVLPALDRLVDAIARGYWLAVMDRQEADAARYVNIVEGSSDGVYEVDLDGRIRYANAALGVILGRSPSDLAGLRLADALDAATEVPFDAPFAEVAVRRADGVVRILEIRTVERLEADGVAGYEGVVRDLTAAVQAEQLRNDFLALLGQELRQPLTTVLGLGATLEEHGDELGTDRVAAVGERIRQQAERMSRLADDLYDISRLELGSLVLSPRTVDLAPVVGAALASVGDVGGAADAASSVAVAVPPGLRVVADPRRFEQVVANLVENALRFGRPPVEVDARATADGVAITVRDHGDGVDPALVPTLFSELRPLTGRPRRSAASGLGLALVRGLVEAMGGRVRYEPPSAGGATFVVTLPRG
jgi:PAS domain S-box-containing protein